MTEEKAFAQGQAACADHYAKGANPYRGKAGPLCRAWNMGWTAMRKEMRKDEK